MPRNIPNRNPQYSMMKYQNSAVLLKYCIKFSRLIQTAALKNAQAMVGPRVPDLLTK